jgi:hypothetical protein
MNKLLGSSANPEELSLTIKGMIATIIPLFGLILKAAGHQVDDATLQEFTNTLSTIVVLLGSLAASVMMLIGICRKLYYDVVKREA